MNFQATIEAMRDGSKTETRRIRRPYHRPILSPDGRRILEVRSCHAVGDEWVDRLLWRVGKTYAVQNGRCAKAEGRFTLEYLGAQTLQYISEKEMRREMGTTFADWAAAVQAFDLIMAGPPPSPVTPRRAFAYLWNSIHSRKGERFESNPWVFVLGFPDGMKEEK